MYVDNIGFHKVGNETSRGAITLHLYAPPYQSCRVWMDDSDASKVSRPIVTMYSINGRKVNYDA